MEKRLNYFLGLKWDPEPFLALLRGFQLAKKFENSSADRGLPGVDILEDNP